jgi:hypothetical protein
MDNTLNQNSTLIRKLKTFYKLLCGKQQLEKKITIDMDKDFFPIYKQCKPYTMTSIERMYALYQAVKYIVQQQVEGDFVECGVWKGGSVMLIAATLKQLNHFDRKIYLYDTFEGMSKPTEQDVCYTNESAMSDFSKLTNSETQTCAWANCPLDEVRNNLATIEYPQEQFFFVKGKVEDTIPQTMPGAICLLRLDTDWYESTYHELLHLYPLLIPKGVLIIDDYGHWLGSKQATDEYFTQHQISLLLNRVDYSGRLAIKM